MMAVTFCAAHRAPRSHTEPSFCWEMSPERSLPASKWLQTLGKSSGATPGSSGMAGTAPRAQGLWSVAPAGRAAEGTLEKSRTTESSVYQMLSTVTFSTTEFILSPTKP